VISSPCSFWTDGSTPGGGVGCAPRSQLEAYVPSSDTYIEKDASINNHIQTVGRAARNVRGKAINELKQRGMGMPPPRAVEPA
jgi:hypothetical protein